MIALTGYLLRNIISRDHYPFRGPAKDSIYDKDVSNRPKHDSH